MFPFKKILVPTDFSEPSLCGLKMANEMADKFGSEVIVVNVHKPIPQLPSPRMETADISFDFSNYEKQIAEDAYNTLTKVSGGIMHNHITPRLIVRMGRPADEILKVAEEEDVDSIFIATRGRTGLAHIMFGSVAEKVVRNAKCAVLCIRACD